MSHEITRVGQLADVMHFGVALEAEGHAALVHTLPIPGWRRSKRPSRSSGCATASCKEGVPSATTHIRRAGPGQQPILPRGKRGREDARTDSATSPSNSAGAFLWARRRWRTSATPASAWTRSFEALPGAIRMYDRSRKLRTSVVYPWAQKAPVPFRNQGVSPTERTQKPLFPAACFEAAGQGFEPQLPGPEPGVLPLDDPATADGVYRVATELSARRSRAGTRERGAFPPPCRCARRPRRTARGRSRGASP